MSRNILQDIIGDFKPEDFTRFFRTKNDKFQHPNQPLHYGDDNFGDGKKLEEITLEDGNLIVCSFQVKQPLSERFGKKTQYELGKKILKDTQTDAGIFIFYDESGNFRFSLIYASYLGRRRDWSTFRRFTYFVSPDLTNKTFLQRIGDGDFSSIEKIKDAFSVEKVTEEFYLQYRQLFEDLVKNLQKNHTFQNEASRNQIDTENFAKKLLGQIVFLYFIQKKGWIGVPQSKSWGDGDKNFLSRLFEESEKSKRSFYDEYLEPLFYDTLNNPRRNSADPSYSSFFKSRIPFLNGGLFEPEYDWKKSFIHLDNKIFGKILEVFDRYNFTVEEESPDDKEVAVDPEMLGKVFENLLPENLRKGKGTYYTPREIVYYMCRESLVNYLVSNHSNLSEEKIRQYFEYSSALDKDIGELKKIWKGESFTSGQWKELDELLRNIKVCDPACGSGAFLIGMLNEIVKIRIFLQLTPDSELFSKEKGSIKELSEYQLKKETIQNCLYGVDIDPGAIEIAKLRLWLSLIVDYNLEHVEPLPNLDYRLMTGNSLIEEFEGVKFYNGEGDELAQASLLPQDDEREKKIEELKAKIKEYFNLHDDDAKKKKREEINALKDWFIRSSLEQRKKQIQSELKEEERKANMLDEKSRKQYLSSWGDKFITEGKIEEVLDNLHNSKKARPFFIWKLEFIDVFEEKGGFDVMIANPPYINVKRGISDKEKEIYKKTYKSATGQFDLFSLFIEKGLSLTMHSLTFIVPKPFINNENYEVIRTQTTQSGLYKIIIGSEIFESADVESCVFFVAKDKAGGVIDILEFSQGLFFKKDPLPKNAYERAPFHIISTEFNKNDLKIIQKINTDAESLRNLLEITRGVEAGKNDKSITSEKTDSKLLTGENLSRYRIGYEGLYIQLNENDSKKFKRGALFQAEKIIIRRVGNELISSFDTEGYVVLNTIYCGIPKDKNFDPKYITAILNSRVISFWFKKIFVLNDRLFPYVRQSQLEFIPIKKALGTEQGGIAKLVDKILAITKDDDYLENTTKQAKVHEYEKQIDQLVYDLYGLTKEEIKIVENYGK